MFSKDDTRDDHDAIKKEFALLETTLNPFHPYIPACGDSENEKESDEEERLEVVDILTSWPCAVPKPVRRTTSG